MRAKLTYANVTATLALIVAVGGASAFAATQLAKNSVGSKQLKKSAVTTAKIKNEAVTAAKVKKGTLTGTQINASTLGKVPNAANADTVDGSNASDLRTSSAFDQNGNFGTLAGTFQNVASTTITTHGSGRILATGSASLFNAGVSEAKGACRIIIDGDASLDYHAVPPATVSASMVIAVNYAVTRPPGTYTASLLCRAASGEVSMTDAAINVYGLGE